ncbi:uncharacterized protein LOC143180145 [Calliopsis andreniformis]|uniref:uncharacterized protein LOC143180145 n=1 Tax=Calliopsis andreniformis TaxID=337506 RepID=UPI003FCCE7D3
MSVKFSIFLLAVAMTYCIIVGQVSERRCIPNRSYYDGCNTCFCSADSVSIGCTERDCAVYDPDTNQFVGYKPKPAPEDFWKEN